MDVSRVPRSLRACPGSSEKRERKKKKRYVGYMLQILVSHQLAPVSHLGWR